MICLFKVGDEVIIHNKVFLGCNYYDEVVTIRSVNTGYIEGVYLLSGIFTRAGKKQHIQFTSDDCNKYFG